MSTTYEKAPQSVADTASELMAEISTHTRLCDAKVRIDYLFAHAEENEDGELVGYAMVTRGQRVLGKSRKTTLKERAAGRADCEITLDGDWWMGVDEPEQRAVLDHAMTHFEVVTKKGVLQTDDLGRPRIKIREHDVEAGWFIAVAQRHGSNSQECRQARAVYDHHGQALLMGLNEGTVTVESLGRSVTVPANRFSQIAKSLATAEPARSVVDPHEKAQ